MYYLSFCAENYIGFFAKLGLEKIDIDFSGCKNKIISIQGDNGCGKSTLIDILHFFPDSNSFFIPKKVAKKQGQFVENDIKYSFNITHGVKKNDERETPKAYIRKEINGNMVEMNPNGNVTSYKEFLYNEFGLDSAFLLLSALSISNKGIVDRSPTERKKYINILIASIEIYNKFLKTLSKRRSNVKSIMNNISSKLNMIGDEDELKLTIQSLNNRISNILNEKDMLIQNLASAKSKISLLDPNGTIQESYNKMYNDLVEINEELDILNKDINKYKSKINTDINKDNISNISSEFNAKLISIDYFVETNEKEIRRILDDREKESKELSELSAKLDALNVSSEIINIENEIKICDNKLEEFKSILDLMGYKDYKGDPENISKEEFIVGLNALKEIKEIIDIARDDIANYNLKLSVDTILNGVSLSTIQEIDNQIETIKNDINTNKIELAKFEVLNNEIKKLENRDKNCTIDTCPFIKDAVIAIKQNPEQNIIKISSNIEKLSEELSSLESYRTTLKEVISGVQYLNSICKYLESNISIIKKLPINCNIFNSKESIINAILEGYSFNSINDLYQYIEYANIFEEKKIVTKKKNELMSDFKLYMEKNKIVDQIMNQINELNIKINDSTEKIEKLKLEIINLESDKLSLKNNLFNIEELNKLFIKQDKLLEIKNSIINQYNTIKNNMIEIKNCISEIEQFDNKISNIESQIKPLMNDRDKMNHSLLVSKEYKSELEEFNKKYFKINTLRKYCNPSEEGIQLLFIELYFHKTLSLTNDLLKYVFNGQYQIGKPIINGDEFKIPVTGNLLPVDDVSSMSESQRAIIGMALSFSLLIQSSTVYNIPSLDEVDEPLDTENRLAFGIFLEQIINILEIQQLFYVSHNSEVSLDNADIILLSDKPETINKFAQYNIIYRAI